MDGNMRERTSTTTLTIHAPAQYVIEVYGDLGPSWSDEMNGMFVERTRREDGMQITRLSGRLADQAALAGILNHLYLLRYPILLVERNAEHSHTALALD
jgi:hypothetical protein